MKRILACVSLAISVAACGNSTSAPSSSSGPVTYQITGTANHVLVTYQNSSGGTSQTGSALPFNYDLTAKTGDFLYVSARIDTSPDTGNMTVSISKSGSVIQTGTAAGFGSIVTESATY